MGFLVMVTIINLHRIYIIINTKRKLKKDLRSNIKYYLLLAMFDFVEHYNFTMRWIADNMPPIEDPEYFINRTDDYDYENDDFYNVDRNYDMLEYLYGNNYNYNYNCDYDDFEDEDPNFVEPSSASEDEYSDNY